MPKPVVSKPVVPEPAVEVAPGVYVFTSRREHTTSTLVVGDAGRGSRALLVDPAWEPDELASIAADTRGRALALDAGFATHAHYDHVLWHSDLADVPRLASPVTAARATATRDAMLVELGLDWSSPELADLVGRVEPLPSTGLVIGAEPIEVITHDGHEPGHSALWIDSRRVLLAGDMLSDVEPPLPLYEQSDGRDRLAQLVAYLAALDALAPYVARADVVVPGHGTPTTRPMLRLDADRRHLDDMLAAS